MSERDTTRARWTVRADEAGRALFDFLRSRVPSEPTERIREAIASRIRVSWSDAPRDDLPVEEGGTVRLLDDAPAEVAVDDPIPVIARGPGWMAVAKPAGVPVHPVRSVRINSLIERLRRMEGRPGLRLAHRLDRDTSGALLLAEDAATAARLGRAFQRGEVRKEYVAVVRGVPDDASGTIDIPIGPHPTSAVRVRLAAGAGRRARTSWRVERVGSDRARLRIVPETGRRHQIRVHLESIGHPIVGDILYGRPDRDYLDLVAGIRDARAARGEPRMLLHCRRLALVGSGPDIEVFCPETDEFDLRGSGAEPVTV